MTVRHGAVLGLAEIAKAVGLEGLGACGDEVRDIPVSFSNRQMPGKEFWNEY